MTSIAQDTLKPIRKRVTKIDRSVTRAAKNTDRALSRAEKRADAAVKSGRSMARSAYGRITGRPMLAVFGALGLGLLFGSLRGSRH